MTKNKLTCSIKARCYGIEKCILRGQKALSRRHRMNVVSWSWFWFIDGACKIKQPKLNFCWHFCLVLLYFSSIKYEKRVDFEINFTFSPNAFMLYSHCHVADLYLLNWSLKQFFPLSHESSLAKGKQRKYTLMSIINEYARL